MHGGAPYGELRSRLRESAESYEPDRARILARVERGMAGGQHAPGPDPRPTALGWFRVVGATAAVAGVLAVGGYAVASALKAETPNDQTVAVSPSPAPSPERSSPPASPTAGTSTSTGADVEDGPLWSDGSVDPHSNEFWAQSNVTVRNEKQLTSLTVVLKVRQTGGVTSTGSWRSAPEDDFTASVAEKGGFLTYTWTLKPGRTVWPGEWVFAGQYDHDRGGRDAGDDAYTADARADREELAVGGDFAQD
ncbi:hypothetical protein C6Y14_18005 [Streptomyces dioscori]|uniref:Uncharacterized protein n=1 Tax=Streptomyces dioscori TaxID=2109333 RepID=A0A2P8Q7X1_9ACTN|nr:hypothetical protein C6Y14_18005 [Streptomyces dioscori]